MVSESVLKGVSATGTALVIVLLCSQIPAVWKAIRTTRLLTHLSPIPTIGQGMNFVSWLIYAIVKGDSALLVVNIIGACFTAIYLTIFFIFNKAAERKTLFVYLISIILITVGINVGILVPHLDHEQKVQALGAVAVAWNVVMYAAPLSQVYLAMKSMNPEVMPVLLTATGLACSVFWGLYGIFNGDWFVLGPNAAGVGLSIIQLILAFYINIAVKRNPSLRKYAPLDGADTEQANLALYGQESMSYSSSSHAERLV